MWKILFEGIWLSAMSISDFRSRRIPVWVIGTGIPLAVISVVQNWNSGNLNGTELGLSLIPGALLLILSITQKAGYGDGFVVVLLGLMEGKRNHMRIFFLSFIFMSVCALVLLFLRKADKSTKMPYLPFLLAAWLAERIFL